MTCYRIEVGHNDGATPREIVGAIANESGIQGRYIGRIDIRKDHSLVDLPEGMPRDVFQHLKRVYVRGKALRISTFEQPRYATKAQRDDKQDAPRSYRPRDERPGPSRRGSPDRQQRGDRDGQPERSSARQEGDDEIGRTEEK